MMRNLDTSESHDTKCQWHVYHSLPSSSTCDQVAIAPNTFASKTSYSVEQAYPTPDDRLDDGTAASTRYLDCLRGDDDADHHI